MSRLVLILMLVLFARAIPAQDSRPATPAEAAFHNKVRNALSTALPTTFRDWDVTSVNLSMMEDGEPIDYCEGVTCWRDEDAHATYDGMQIKDDFFLSSQKEAQALKQDDPDYTKKLHLALIKFENATKLEVFLFVNTFEVAGLTYCKAKGVKKATPPPGWNTYYFSNDAMSCFNYENEEGNNTQDVSVFSMGMVPQISETHGRQLYSASLRYTLNRQSIKDLKAQNVVIMIRGAKDNALELVKKMNTKSLADLLK